MSRGTDPPSRGDIFEILSNERRRHVVRVLQESAGVLEIGTLAERVAAQEHGKPVQEVTYEQRKRVYTALQQSHLPMMDDVDALAFDKHRGTVEPTPGTEDLDYYLRVVPRAELRRSRYYLGLAASAGALAVGAATDFAGLFEVPAFTMAAFLTVTFGAAALVHLARTGRHPTRSQD